MNITYTKSAYVSIICTSSLCINEYKLYTESACEYKLYTESMHISEYKLYTESVYKWI